MTNHLLTIEDLRSWWRRNPRSGGFRHFPALSSLIRYYVRENGELTLLRCDDSVVIYGPGSSPANVTRRTHPAGSEVASTAWRAKLASAVGLAV